MNPATYPGALEVIEQGTCPGCGAEVELLYEHERERNPLCGDCFEALTTNNGDYSWEG